MKIFEFCLIVGLALILGMCLLVPVSEANWAAAETDSGSTTNNASSSGFLSSIWDKLPDWLKSPFSDRVSRQDPGDEDPPRSPRGRDLPSDPSPRLGELPRCPTNLL